MVPAALIALIVALLGSAPDAAPAPPEAAPVAPGLLLQPTAISDSAASTASLRVPRENRCVIRHPSSLLPGCRPPGPGSGIVIHGRPRRNIDPGGAAGRSRRAGRP